MTYKGKACYGSSPPCTHAPQHVYRVCADICTTHTYCHNTYILPQYMCTWGEFCVCCAYVKHVSTDPVHVLWCMCCAYVKHPLTSPQHTHNPPLSLSMLLSLLSPSPLPPSSRRRSTPEHTHTDSINTRILTHANTHPRARAHAHALSLPHTHAQPHPATHQHTRSHACTYTTARARAHARALSLPHTHTLPVSMEHTDPLARSRMHAHSLSLIHTHCPSQWNLDSCECVRALSPSQTHIAHPNGNLVVAFKILCWSQSPRCGPAQCAIQLHELCHTQSCHTQE